jgi:NADH-quinone oxidoreductase B subunit
VQSLAERVSTWARKRSPWLFHVNACSCNGCDIEVVAALTPKYDAERFGAVLMPSPRHADVLVATGVASPQIKDRLIRIYQQIPEPKYVLAVGACACGGGVFKGCYNAGQGIDNVLPVDMFVPGCPPRPEAILYGIVKLLGKVRGTGKPS